MAQVGLVLGGGGLVGHAYHAGTLRALAARGWDARTASVIVGTSAGSGVGALLRAGLPPADVAARVLGEPLTPEGARVVAKAPRPATGLPPPTRRSGTMLRPASPELLARAAMRLWPPRPGHFMAGALPYGEQPTAPIGDRIRAVYAGRHWPDDRLWLCALRLRDGHRAVFGRDPSPNPDVGTAVEASSAIPGYFAPVSIAGERYVDGGAHSPTNADVLRRLQLDVVVAISPMSMRAGSAITPRLASRWWWHRQLAQEVAPLKRDGVRVVLIEPGPADLDAMGLTLEALDGSRMPAVVRQAEQSAAALLADLPPLG